METGLEKRSLIESEFLDHLSEKLGLEHNREKALRIAKKVFYLLRQRLSYEKSKRFVNQLPAPLDAWYIEGWESNYNQDKVFFKTLLQFAHDLVQMDMRESLGNFYGVEEVLVATRVLLETIAHYLSPEEMDEMIQIMPSELKQLMESLTMCYK
jgi:uncharacterized protein (DUF2267 family)